LGAIVEVVSADDGGYDICVAGGSPLRIEASGYASVDLIVDAGGRIERNVVLVPEGLIEGVVLRADTREPVPGAKVWAFPLETGNERPAGQVTFTDAQGAFLMSRLHFGRFRLGATAEGLQMTDVVEVSVVAGATNGANVLTLESQVGVEGHVVSRGQPVAGAQVQVVRKNPVASSAWARTQADGSFVISRANVGRSTVVVLGYRVVTPASLDVGYRGLAEIRVEVTRLASISGRVLRAGRPVRDATVITRMQRSRSDLDGRYEIIGLEPGEYSVSARSVEEQASGKSEAFHLAEGEQKILDLELTSGAVVAGKVVDSNGAPLPLTRVQWTHASTGDATSCLTDSLGRFECGSIAGGGDYSPLVFAPAGGALALEWAGGVPPVVRLVDGASRAERVELKVRLQRERIAGRVLDSEQVPVPDARVSLRAIAAESGAQPFFSLPFPEARTGADGAFLFEGLAPGAHVLRVSAGDGGESVQQVTAGDLNVVITIGRVGAIRGELQGFDSVPRVTIESLDGTPRSIAPVVNGTKFRADNISSGRYLVSAIGGRGGDVRVVDVTRDSPSDVQLVSRGTGDIEGMLTELPSGKPLAGFRCFAALRAGGFRSHPSMWSPASSEVSGGDGKFRLRDVPAGDISVTCTAGGENLSSPSVSASLTQGATLSVSLQAVRRSETSSGGLRGLVIDPRQDEPRILDVEPSSAAALAGIRRGERVLAVDDVMVEQVGAQGVIILIANRPSHVPVGLTLLGESGARRVLLPATP
jgi:hypothetical protein